MQTVNFKTGVNSTCNPNVAHAQGPSVKVLDVRQSSVHLGPEIISIAQDVNKVELIKGKCMGVEMVSIKRANRLRCGVVVFLSWSLLVAVGLTVYLTFITRSTPSRLDIDLNEPWYIRREDWQALPAYEWINTFMELPQSYVIIGHSAASACDGRDACSDLIRDMQNDHQRRGFGDIAPNFLVGGDGYVFEGRGANLVGAMMIGWNAHSISIMFVGHYSDIFPNQWQFDHLNSLLEVLVKEGILRDNYTLFGQCQIRPWTVAPGRNLMSQMHNFPNWNSTGEKACL